MHSVQGPVAIEQRGEAAQGVRSRFWFRHRGLIGLGLFVPAGVAVLFSVPGVLEDSPLGLSLNAAGWLAFFAYAALRVWATLYIGGRKESELQTEGPYSVCRHPLYLGSLAFSLAVACMLKSWVFGVMLLPAILLYLRVVVRSEEHFLALRFREAFHSYRARTPCCWPRWSAFHTLPQVSVGLKQLKMEAVRLSRAGLFIVTLQTLMHLRGVPWWPHWFNLR